MNAVKLAVVAAPLVAATAFADTDIYGNVIQYDDQHRVVYRFWYGSETAESMSTANSASGSFTVTEAFEPRFRTSGMSDGKCHHVGLSIVIR